MSNVQSPIPMRYILSVCTPSRTYSYRVESFVLISLIVGGLGLSVVGAAVYDIGRAFSLW